MAPRIAKSLDTLRSQINAAYPGRNRSSDGWIGDAAHRRRPSDHNPNRRGVVQALDITHDPRHGVDGGKIVAALVASRDPRVKYIIWDRRIITSYKTGRVPAWTWRRYSGSNPHNKHFHVSASNNPALYDDPRPWALNAAQVAIMPADEPAVVEDALNMEMAEQGSPADSPWAKAANVIGGSGALSALAFLTDWRVVLAIAGVLIVGYALYVFHTRYVAGRR